ncbi:MAG: D-alanine--D-alanine ligase [Clostridium sp.]|nr:D-alanine--D-alanine ligase [Clostridium sp.]MCM1546974.1 D-alanine--D-alanine ligase [Ruminococcus sp.]
MSKIKVAVLFGGVSSEHDISLISASNIIENMPKDKYEIICIGITKKGRWLYYPGDVSNIASGEWEKDTDCASAIISPDPIHKGILVLENGEYTPRKIDVVFPVLHGKNGEDGTVQGLLDLARIPYVGCGLLASASCMDKAHTHTVLDYNNIRTAEWRMVGLRDLNRLDKKCIAIAEELGFPVFVKPANAGSSIGINKATDLESLKEAVKFAFSHDNKVIIEEYIKGRELEVAVFGYDSPFASFVGELSKSKDFYDYESKYINNSVTQVIPAALPEETIKEIRETAISAYKAMGCKGLSRVDFFLSEDDEVILNEINTMPGFTSISMYPMLMADLGMTYGYLIDKLIEQAIDNSERNY